MRKVFILLALLAMVSCASERPYDTKREMKQKTRYYNAIMLGKKKPKPPR